MICGFHADPLSLLHVPCHRRIACRLQAHASSYPGATKHRIGYIGVHIMLLLDMTQFKVVKGKRLGSVLIKQFSRAQPGWGLGRAPPQNIIRLRCVRCIRCIRCGVSSHPRILTFSCTRFPRITGGGVFLRSVRMPAVANTQTDRAFTGAVDCAMGKFVV